MFESDDFDEALSQYDLSDLPENQEEDEIENSNVPKERQSVADSVTKKDSCQNVNKPTESLFLTPKPQPCKSNSVNIRTNEESAKRKIINSYFDRSSKRKFPGPAGLLNGSIHEKEDGIWQIELLSQDVAFSENHLNGDVFETPIWKRIKQDMGALRIDLIKNIKQEHVGSSRRRKADTVVALVESVDRSASDPMLLLRDTTGGIKCTLHRDAWAAFSTFIVADCCALALRKPTILTTGSSYKRHYLNITLSNIFAIYSTVLCLGQELEDKPLPDGYSIADVDGFSVIKLYNSEEAGTSINDSDFLDGLDCSMFTDEDVI